MSQPSPREYSDAPGWESPDIVSRLRNLGWEIVEVCTESRPYHAVADSRLFPGFRVHIHHPMDHVSGRRYHSFVPLRNGRGVNFLTPEKMHRDVERRSVGAQTQR